MVSSLVVACEDGHLEVARALLEAKADQRATDDGTTPLFVAAQNLGETNPHRVSGSYALIGIVVVYRVDDPQF